MHVVCKKLIWTLNIIFVQVYPCDKHLQSQKLEWKCFVHFSVKEFLYNIFLSLLLDSVLRSVIPFPHSRLNILRLPSSPLKCACSNYVFIVKEIRQRRALQAYAIKETTGNIQRSDLYEATRCRMKLTCETIFMIDIDEMLPKLLHRLKYASIYLNKIQNVLTKQQGSTV